MSKSQWYSSKRHFETEMSYEEYLEELKRKRKNKTGNYLKQLNNIFR